MTATLHETPASPSAAVSTPATVTTERIVRVWFGEHVIAKHRAEPAYARRYADAMARRFKGLRITNDPLDPASVTDGSAAELPSETIWSLTVQ